MFVGDFLSRPVHVNRWMFSDVIPDSHGDSVRSERASGDVLFAGVSFFSGHSLQRTQKFVSKSIGSAGRIPTRTGPSAFMTHAQHRAGFHGDSSDK